MKLTLLDKLILTKAEKKLLEELDELCKMCERQLVRDNQRVSQAQVK